MGAQSLNLGGAPAGPAGTGKTETTKDLAKALAKQCVVFNCSPEMDYLMVGKFFKGLSSSGAWCCFDEFNRIFIEVLSVIAQQLLQLFSAKKTIASYNEEVELEFDSCLIVMKPTFNVFITMNPGYAGRSELPDNLAALFRPMAMMVPDYAMIGEISFYAFGFEEGRHLAKKMVTTFQLCSEQLSSQCHYDYGMRAVKTVIEAAGLNKRKYPEQSEPQILLRALRDVNVPKFLKDDLPLFENIITDLFPGVERPSMDYGALEQGCNDASKRHHLQPTEYFVKKQFELFDMIQVRHGMMLVGPTGGGKTCCYRALQLACTSLRDTNDHESPYQATHVHVLNPKAITQNQLYGSFDEVTREWSDGVAAELIRNAVRDNVNPDHHWVMFDGPVDALWIESMNTVLDDNKKLCLVSGEIIALTSKMRMQFEVEDLEVASPATVSRCGMIYMEPESLGLGPFFDSWLEQLPETFNYQQSLGETIRSFLEEIIPKAVVLVKKRLKAVVETQDNNLVQSLMRLLDCYFVNYRPTEIKPAAQFKEAVADLKNALEPLLWFCFIWSFGATCDGPSRVFFSEYVWGIVDAELHPALDKELHELHIPVPELRECEFVGIEKGHMVYDYFYSIENKCWVPWMDTIPAYQVPRNARYEEIVVPSLDSVRLVYIFELLVLHDKHVLAPGPTGTGKSVNIALWLQKFAPDNFAGVFINFSAQTGVNMLQDQIDSKLEKRRRGVYGPPAGKKMVLFVDDLNMPLKEYYGAQPPIELLRQWHDHQGWFNRKELVAFKIVDTVMVSAMGPPGGGRTFITERLKRHYSTTSYAELSDESISQIFNVIGTYFFQSFDESVSATLGTMIEATLKVYHKALEDLLPTPSKSHYLFNLRDIWKVFLGISQLNSKRTGSVEGVTRCWVHEVQRVFGDRLTDKADLNWLKENVDALLVNNFSADIDTIYHSERLIFASFMTQEIDSRVYEELTDMKAMKETIEEYLDDYNQVNTATMPLVMFLDACEHNAKICRVLNQPAGNVLLLGVGGSGRQSLTRLSSYIVEAECFQIQVAKGYGMTEFKDDLKRCLMVCGVEDKVQIFLFCDTQIVKEDFVEAVNNVLNSGDVPNLYAIEDFESIATSCRKVCQELGMQPTKANLFAAYLTRVKKNVHVVLAFSPVGDSFRNRLRMFPSLVNCCTIDWFHEWPGEALYSVAKQQITGQQVELPDLEGSLVMFQGIHQSVEHTAIDFLAKTHRHVYVTPTSYLELLSSFVQILDSKRKEVGTAQHRYQVGLTKIEGAEEQVAGLQQMLQEKKPFLEETQKQVAEMMVVITKDKAEAEEVSEAVAKEEAEAKVKAEETQAIKDDAQKDLDEALPALEVAVQCLKKLNKSHIQEVKALANPPGGVRLACEGVCIMFGLKPVKKTDPNNPAKKIDDYWEVSQKQVLQDPKKLLEDLFDFDKDNIPDRVIQTIAPYMDREDFDPAAIKKASIACEAICMWTRAMYKYHFVAKGVEPKRQMLREAEADLKICQDKLEVAQARLQEVNDKIAKLEADFNAAVAKQDQLQADMDLCIVKLERAHKLINGLGGEKARWGQNVTDLSKRMVLLPGDCIVAAGMISYAGPFNSESRQKCETQWANKLMELKIDHTENCSMKTVLGEPVKIQQWVVAALPNDALSIENGIIIDRSRRWPLMIDPQRQANKYIKNMGKETETGIDVCKLSDKNFLRTLELGIQFGKWVLLENIALSLDPALEPILLQQKIKDGSGYTIKLGDKTITYNETFKFFLTTTLPNPHYSPETSVKVTLLNFAITPSGLEDQMLGIVVAKERPDLEEQKNNLVVQNAKMNKTLKEIEDDILRLLATSEGDVLEDDTLVDKVTTSKTVAGEIAEKQEIARATEKTIDEARESYRPVAYRTAVLFFCIVELAGIDPMYQYSLQWFQQLFSLSIDAAPKSDVFEERLGILQDSFTEGLYQNICRGLFERDKPLFSFALCIRIMMGDHNVDAAELRYLLVGPTSDMVENGPPIPAEWVGKPRWNEILTLSLLPPFQGFDNFFQENVSEFRKLYDAVEADQEALPGHWEEKLTPMQKLCFIRAFRLDNLKSAVISFIAHFIGQKFVEPPTFDIAKSFADSVNTTPLIFILSPGTDPVADVILFADKLGMGKRFESISLGQGQGPKATKMIENAQGTGGWVLLSNCHLMESWMSSLEAIVENLNPEQMSNNFRLWLTSMPAKSFPVQILQNGVKMTNEPPTGLRANLLRSYSMIADSIWQESSKPEIFKILLFSFCFFHAVVQDRRKFGPIGWNIAYGFTPEDLAVCKSQLMTFINQYDDVPYKVLNFLGAKINYGGRVTDDKDKLLISTILETFICSDAVEKGSEYKFSASGKYHAPEGETVAEMVEYIKTLPLFPMPEAFGLHENCNITVSQDEASRLLTGMQSMVALGSGGEGGQSQEDVMDATAASIQERLPKPFPLDICEEKFPTIYEDSMNTVVKQECLRYNKLLWEMAANLKDFRKAIKGLIVMTQDLESLGNSMFVNEQPALWVKLGPLSLKPLSSWYLDILARCAFFQMWYDLGKAPPCFWVSGIFFPQAFFTGAIQNFARQYNEEIDLLSYKQIPLDDIKDAKKELTEPPKDGVYVYGIFLEGARWSTATHQIEDSRPKELYTDLPPLWFCPIKNREPDILDYRCPCYKVVSRKGVLLTTGHSTNFVLYIEMKTDKPISKWVKAGMAAFLALKY
jgi:dynein heavy chain